MTRRNKSGWVTITPFLAVPILALLLCTACDGHVRSFAPRTAALPGGSAAPARDEAELLSVIGSVAAQRGYTQREPSTGKGDPYEVVASYGKALEHSSVTLSLTRDTRSGSCRVVIIDWPSFVRSAESKAVEQAIQSELR